MRSIIQRSRRWHVWLACAGALHLAAPQVSWNRPSEVRVRPAVEGGRSVAVPAVADRLRIPRPAGVRDAEMIDESWARLEGRVYRRISLWQHRDGRRERAHQVVTAPASVDEPWAVEGESRMAADRLIVARAGMADGWEKLESVAAKFGWNIARSSPRSRVATLTGPGFSGFDLAALDAAFDSLGFHLGAEYRVGWSYFLQPALVPGDTRYAEQWAWTHLGAPQAWSETTGSPDVVIAVVDSGIDLFHPELAPNLWTNPNETSNGIDDSGSGFVDDVHGWNFVDQNNQVNDPNGHGTGVAGIIGAVGNNGFGIAGGNWSARLMPLRVGHLNIKIEDVIDAIDYAVDRRVLDGENVVAINLSLGGRLPGVARDEETPLFLAIERARDAGILCIAAAGNDGVDNDAWVGGEPNHYFPSDLALDNVVSVAASTAADGLAPSSNFGGQSVDLAAPGVDILTTDRNGGFRTVSGTSLAAAHVTGLVALLAAANPDLDAPAMKRIVLDGGFQVIAFDGKLAQPVRLAYDDGMAEALRWPRIGPVPEWMAFPFLRSGEIGILPVSVETADAPPMAVSFSLGGESFPAFSEASETWSVSWSPPAAGVYDWTVTATGAGDRVVASVLAPVQVLQSFHFWQAEQFGLDYETEAAGYDAGADGLSLGERFVFGLGIGEGRGATLSGVPTGAVVPKHAGGEGWIRLRLWQSVDSMATPMVVERSVTLAEGSWEPVDVLLIEQLEIDEPGNRVLREIRVAADGQGGFYRLRFDF